MAIHPERWRAWNFRRFWNLDATFREPFLSKDPLSRGVRATMRQFALIFRMDILSLDAKPSPAQMREYMEQWNEWIGWLQEQERLEGGNHLSDKGKVLRKGGVVENSPYVEESVSVAGYIVVSAKDPRDAVRMASKCPILAGDGTSVEVRELAGPG